MKVNIDGVTVAYCLGEIIYIRTDESNKRRIITGITLRCNGTVQYECSFCTEVSYHYEAELSRKPNGLPIIKKNDIGL